MPLGTEAAKLDRDLFRHASNLVLLKVKSAEVVMVSVKQLTPDLTEALFTVPAPDEGKRHHMMAWICRSGTVQIIDGWPL